MRRLWKHYSLSIVLTVMLLVSLGLQTWMGWVHFASEQKSHGEQAQVFGPDGYVWDWGEAVFENWQSEFLQLLTFVVLTGFLVHRGSHESRDSDEHSQASLDRIEARLMRLEALHEELADATDEEIDAIITERVEHLKIRDAVRDDLPPPPARKWYPKRLKDFEDSATAGDETLLH